jgi:hypothetical protein
MKNIVRRQSINKELEMTKNYFIRTYPRGVINKTKKEIIGEISSLLNLPFHTGNCRINELIKDKFLKCTKKTEIRPYKNNHTVIPPIYEVVGIINKENKKQVTINEIIPSIEKTVSKKEILELVQKRETYDNATTNYLFFNNDALKYYNTEIGRLFKLSSFAIILGLSMVEIYKLIKKNIKLFQNDLAIIDDFFNKNMICLNQKAILMIIDAIDCSGLNESEIKLIEDFREFLIKKCPYIKLLIN